MSTTLAEVRTLVRDVLLEPTAIFWSDDELHRILIAGVKDLWRDIVDLKQEHYLRVTSPGDVTMPSGAEQLLGVPADVHKIYLIEPTSVGEFGSERKGMQFIPRDFNHDDFRAARAAGTIYPPFGTIYYAITGQGSPAAPTIIRVAPRLSTSTQVTLSYVPTLEPLQPESVVPIPGEADNALKAWGIAYARAKEREDRTPDPGWLVVYNTEKQHLLHSLGLRQYQEVQITDGMFSELWGS